MIKILAVGKIKNKEINNLINDYITRIKHYTKIEIREIKDSSPEEESKKLIEKIDDEKNVFLLSEEGKEFTSVEFSNIIKENVFFVIGGPFGLSENIKGKYKLISLSKMTFPHEIARLLLVEQIYRGISIAKKLPYHK